MPERFGVKIEDYCDRHYIKDFKKKYSNRRWQLTEEAIRGLAGKPLQIARETKRVDIVTRGDAMVICKGRFKVHGTDTSAKSSGNRFILAVNTEQGISHVLLIYGKDHIKGDHETDWWKGEIKDTYPELRDLL